MPIGIPSRATRGRCIASRDLLVPSIRGLQAGTRHPKYVSLRRRSYIRRDDAPQVAARTGSARFKRGFHENFSLARVSFSSHRGRSATHGDGSASTSSSSSSYYLLHSGSANSGCGDRREHRSRHNGILSRAVTYNDENAAADGPAKRRHRTTGRSTSREPYVPSRTCRTQHTRGRFDAPVPRSTRARVCCGAV